MRTTHATSIRVIVISAVTIVLATALAIVSHAVLPAPVDDLDFDSALVRLVGFPVVAVSYFLLLFAHCAIVLQTFGRRSGLPKLEVGWRFGLAFALLYLVGMQEVVVDASPFEAWGREFVVYQFFMGAGDAVPVFALCMVLAYLTLAPGRRAASARTASTREAIAIVAVIALAFFVQRTIGHTTGLVHSNIESYPVQTHLWTALFGAVLGCVYVVLYPVFSRRDGPVARSIRLVLLTIGINWLLFNSFIGLLFSGVMPQMLLRSGLDTAVVFVASIVVLRYVSTSRANDQVTGPMSTSPK
ncbi:MAG: hypothetical protein EA416_11650 [Trueperaceae bacterium]|nr:MAG: hypothetical protein EA416_11650 [Trueperaceae bacterium]